MRRKALVGIPKSHGLSYSKEYETWRSMCSRCKYPTHKCYHLYGGRGITVCKRWNKFANFYADMGPKPSPQHSIDRINVNGNYTPKNCRWATLTEQARNCRKTVYMKYRGKRMSRWAVYERGKRLVPYPAFVLRLRNGWDIEDALTAPRRGFGSIPPSIFDVSKLSKKSGAGLVLSEGLQRVPAKEVGK